MIPLIDWEKELLFQRQMCYFRVRTRVGILQSNTIPSMGIRDSAPVYNHENLRGEIGGNTAYDASGINVDTTPIWSDDTP